MTRSPLALALLAALACPAQEPASRPARAMKLWRAIPLPPEAHGTFPSAGDLDGDGREKPWRLTRTAANVRSYF